jgi:hypothetical protein
MHMFSSVALINVQLHTGARVCVKSVDMVLTFCINSTRAY